MKNRFYEKPELEIIKLQDCDIITASRPDDPFRGEDDTLEITP